MADTSNPSMSRQAIRATLASTVRAIDHGMYHDGQLAETIRALAALGVIVVDDLDERLDAEPAEFVDAEPPGGWFGR